MDVNDGHDSGRPEQRPRSVDRQPAPDVDGISVAGAIGGAGEPSIHPRLLAIIQAGRYHGMELDPAEFRGPVGEKSPSAAALSTWAQSSGMWARAVRLRWRHLMRFSNTAPVVLLFNDGTAGLLTGVNTEHKVVLIKDPRGPAADPPVAGGRTAPGRSLVGRRGPAARKPRLHRSRRTVLPALARRPRVAREEVASRDRHRLAHP